MKKASIILLSLILLLGAIYVISSNLDKKRERDRKEKVEQEVDEKLEELTISPIIETPTTASGSEEDDSGTGSGEKTQSELLDEENIKILSFTNARQCNTLTLLKEECRNKFVYSLATRNNDITFCDSLQDDTAKQDCQDEIHTNLLQCGDIKNVTLKRKCEYNLNQNQLITQKKEIAAKAAATSDASLCKTLGNYGEKESCIKNVALSTKDASLCNTISTDKKEQDRCFKNVSYDLNREIIREAYEKKDLSLCDKLTDAALKQQCKSMTF